MTAVVQLSYRMTTSAGSGAGQGRVLALVTGWPRRGNRVILLGGTWAGIMSSRLTRLVTGSYTNMPIPFSVISTQLLMFIHFDFIKCTVCEFVISKGRTWIGQTDSRGGLCPKVVKCIILIDMLESLIAFK